MALNDLGKVALTFGGNYSSTAAYERLTVVVGSDGQTYGTTVDNVIGIEPGVTENWQNYWQIVSMRGPKGVGIEKIEKTSTSGTTDTYTIYYGDGTTWTYNVENGKGIQSIQLTSSVDNVDTYTITFGNNQTQTFTVTNARELAPGGTTGQVLMKNSNTDYDVSWENLPIVDDLNTQSAQSSLSANQGYVLNQKKAEASGISVSLPISGWTQNGDEYTQTVSATGVTQTNILIVSPFHASMTAYIDAEIKATSQGNGTVTFTATAIPEAGITVNIAIINTSGVTA